MKTMINKVCFFALAALIACTMLISPSGASSKAEAAVQIDSYSAFFSYTTDVSQELVTQTRDIATEICNENNIYLMEIDPTNQFYKHYPLYWALVECVDHDENSNDIPHEVWWVTDTLDGIDWDLLNNYIYRYDQYGDRLYLTLDSTVHGLEYSLAEAEMLQGLYPFMNIIVWDNDGSETVAYEQMRFAEGYHGFMPNNVHIFGRHMDFEVQNTAMIYSQMYGINYYIWDTFGKSAWQIDQMVQNVIMGYNVPYDAVISFDLTASQSLCNHLSNYVSIYDPLYLLKIDPAQQPPLYCNGFYYQRDDYRNILRDFYFNSIDGTLGQYMVMDISVIFNWLF